MSHFRDKCRLLNLECSCIRRLEKGRPDIRHVPELETDACKRVVTGGFMVALLWRIPLAHHASPDLGVDFFQNLQVLSSASPSRSVEDVRMPCHAYVV